MQTNEIQRITKLLIHWEDKTPLPSQLLYPFDGKFGKRNCCINISDLLKLVETAIKQTENESRNTTDRGITQTSE